MNKINDGGPAFPEAPVSMANLTTRMRPGMTLRDWFAGMAMQAVATMEYGDLSSYESKVKHAYKMADAMIKQREVQDDTQT